MSVGIDFITDVHTCLDIDDCFECIDIESVLLLSPQISEGAECIMINKRFFLMNASITTLVQLKALVSVKRTYTVISSNRF